MQDRTRVDHHIFQFLAQAFLPDLRRQGLPVHAGRGIGKTLLGPGILRTDNRDGGQGSGIGVDDGRTMLPRLAIEREARGHVIHAVDHDLVTAQQVVEPVGPLGAEGLDGKFRVDAPDLRHGGLDLVHANGIQAGKHLAVQVRHVERIEVRQRKAANAHPCQRLQAGAAHAADATDQHPCIAQLLLFRVGHETDVAGREFLVGEGWNH
ncbi:hypothetical protein D3C72_1658300 [compost metagenome]